MEAKLYLTPGSFKPTEADQATTVVIDVLRCTTTICTALQAGAKGVIPVRDVDEAVELRTKLGNDLALLAGERSGRMIEGFQMGNSPLEFTPESVGGKLVVMTTSNGTRAFADARSARTVLAGSLVNVAAVARRVAELDRPLAIVCAGNDGGFSIEDTLCGGMILDELATRHRLDLDCNDAGSLALLLFRSSRRSLHETIAQGEHGRYLHTLGYDDDLRFAAEANSQPVVPELRDGTLIAVEN
jgi:2-phosphosulfolactate phosphatase